MRAPVQLTSFVLLAACSGAGPTESDGRTTETFELTDTRLTVQGALTYPAGTAIPEFTVSETGLVDASVSIQPELDCEYVFAIEPTNSTGNAVMSTRSRSRTITMQGELMPGSYFVGVVGRHGGVSLCSGLPDAGLDFPHTITVTHP